MVPEAAVRNELFWPHFDLWVGDLVMLTHDCEQ